MDVSAPSLSEGLPEDTEDPRSTPSRSAHCPRTLSLAKSGCSECTKTSPPDHQSIYVSLPPVTLVGRTAYFVSSFEGFRNRPSFAAASLRFSKSLMLYLSKTLSVL